MFVDELKTTAKIHRIFGIAADIRTGFFTIHKSHTLLIERASWMT